MVRELMHDVLFLARKAETATRDDINIAEDLLETLVSHKDECVGMAANMIGEAKAIICFDNGGTYMTMFNPEIIKADGPYNTEESCLSLLGGPRPVKRFRKIKVKYTEADSKIKIKTFEGWTAQIIQHEIDHLNGVLI